MRLLTGESRMARGFSIALLDLAVIGVQAIRCEIRQPVDQSIQLGRGLAGIDARPAHSNIQIDQHRYRPFEPLHGRGQRAG